jgi:hypothetical protein
VLYLRCGYNYSGGTLELYATIDLDQKIAKFSAEAVDELKWSPAEITNATIKWSFGATRWQEEYVLNRYSGHLNLYRHHNELGNSLTVFTCQRTAQPVKKF